MPIKKLKTGVPGLDKILKGGVKEGNSFLVCGGPGIGKTIMAIQFLLEGAKRGEPGLLLLYDGVHETLDYADSLGINLRKYVKSGLIKIIAQDVSICKITSLADPLKLIRQKKFKRVVLDSLTMFAYVHVAEEKDYRKGIVGLLHNLKDVTLLATMEVSGTMEENTELGPEHFIFDGLICLKKVRQEAAFERVLYVMKMRGQDHLINIFPFSIAKGGVKVYPDQLPFALLKGEKKT